MAQEWTDPKHADVVTAYWAARDLHRYWLAPRRPWFRRPRWCDGFAMVADPETGAVFTAQYGLPPKPNGS